jgi:transcriptional regulator GlxA family with amidase domain
LGVARGRSEVDTTWEQLEEFKRRFSEVKLEDELFGGDGGNVVDAFIRKQYQRRQK